MRQSVFGFSFLFSWFWGSVGALRCVVGDVLGDATRGNGQDAHSDLGARREPALDLSVGFTCFEHLELMTVFSSLV